MYFHIVSEIFQKDIKVQYEKVDLACLSIAMVKFKKNKAHISHLLVCSSFSVVALPCLSPPCFSLAHIFPSLIPNYREPGAGKSLTIATINALP